MKPAKAFGGKAYGSIPHMPGSKRGPGDHGISEAHADIITGKQRAGMRVYAQEKIDGTCMSVAKIDGKIVALGRKGHAATTAPYEHMRLFATWVEERADAFDALLGDGERVCGEWLLMATSIRYRVHAARELFWIFDVMRGHERSLVRDVERRCMAAGLCFIPGIEVGHVYHARTLATVTGLCVPTDETPEGVIYRVERRDAGEWKHSFLAKWTRADFEPGKLLADGGHMPAWNVNPWHQAPTVPAPGGLVPRAEVA